MVAQKFGKSDWNEEIKTGRPLPQKKDTFMSLRDGSNLVRIVTEPYQYLSFKHKEKDDPGFGYKVTASVPVEKDPLYLRGFRPKRRWMVGVINRASGQYELLDISVAVYKDLQNFNRDEDYGSPQNYDIDIKVDRSGGPQGYYSVVPKPPKPMSAADLEIVKQVDLEALIRRTAPLTAEQVKSRVDAIRDKRGLPAINWDEAAQASNASTSSAPVDLSSDDHEGDDSEDFDFPAHQTA